MAAKKVKAFKSAVKKKPAKSKKKPVRGAKPPKMPMAGIAGY